MPIFFRKSLALVFFLLLLALAQKTAVAAPGAPASPNRGRPVASGSIMGTVSDQSGKPLAGALIVILRQGAAEIVRQARTDPDGRFRARLAAGSYLLRAAADGFNTVDFEAVQITPSSELVYRFNLVPIGSGRTAPERRIDRDETKWRLRAAQSRRSIFQLDEEQSEIVAAITGTTAAAAASDEADRIEAENELAEISAHGGARLRPQGVIETYAITSAHALGGSFSGVGLNFALSQPLNDSVNLILAGQTGSGGAAAQRFEAMARARLGGRHRISLGAGVMQIGGIGAASDNQHRLARGSLGQVSLNVLDEWVAREGVIVVLGMDYSRFTGAGGGGDALSPRIGLQYDLDSRTRVRAAYAPGGGERAQSAAQFEDGQVVFREARLHPIVYAQGQALMEQSRRLELGIERELDMNSSLEATAFFDTTENRGVGLLSAPVSAFAGDADADMTRVAHQQGAARGLRVLYSRRLSSTLKASAGYSFGRGQELSAAGVIDPAKLWSNGFFQTAAAQLEATLAPGTRVRTIFRFSPGATVFAIDPFAGRLAVYDPSLSFYVTQELPAFGLPVRVEAVLDARNLLDAQAGAVDDGETALLVGATRRSVRGGISLRF